MEETGFSRLLSSRIPKGPIPERQKAVRTGTRTQNLLLRRQAPYPLGHTDNRAVLDYTTLTYY